VADSFGRIGIYIFNEEGLMILFFPLLENDNKTVWLKMAMPDSFRIPHNAYQTV
jgi:hypothetical protein